MSMFKKASRRRVYLKIGLMGASGAGKTRSALELAKGLAEGGPIAVIDTENGSASLYSHVCEFDVADIDPPFDPEKYIRAIREAEEAGFKVLIIDSFSHAWKYLLDKKESLDKRGGNQNRYTNWGPVKQEADRLKDAILQSRIHIIACMRAKTEYTQENGKVQKVGLAAIQEPDVEYEFTTVFQIDMAHNAQQTKDRTGLFGDRIFRIDPKTGQSLLNWLESADDQSTYIPPASATENPAQQRVTEMRGRLTTPQPNDDPDRHRKAVFAITNGKGIEYSGDGKRTVLAFLSKSPKHKGDTFKSSKDVPLEVWEERHSKLRAWEEGQVKISVLDEYLSQQGQLSV